jgi:peptidoglycan-associated lipoprotein
MKLRQTATLALAALALVGCRKKETRPAAGPTNTPAAVDPDAERRQREAEEARLRALRGAEERRALRDRITAELSEIIYFNYDSPALTPEAEEKLRAKAEILRRYPEVRVRVEGHADQRGSTEYNLLLGQARANTVQEFLAGYGISADRIQPVSLGEERPLAEGEGEEVWARNRRAEFRVVGGLP